MNRIDKHHIFRGIQERMRCFTLPSRKALDFIDMVQEWMRRCNKLHCDTCVPTPISMRPPNEVPKWVIDTQQDCIVPGTAADRYIALSYVWPENQTGAFHHVLFLENERIADFRKPGFLRSEESLPGIPDVIKYAMRFTLRMDERYLWVDRLCVAQNDGSIRDEVMRMDKIYAGAYLTLIAAAPESFFSKYMESEWPPPAFKIGYSSCQGDPDGVRSLVRFSARQFYGSLSASEWGKRGWTYQEQILCRRALILMETGFFWDCQCSIWLDLQFQEKLLSPVRERSQRFADRWWPDFGFYIDLVCPFNGRKFTYPQDALAGFSGILQTLAPVFSGGFLSGLPLIFLDQALIWKPFSKGTRRFDRSKDSKSIELTSSHPSWSWCGWECFVDPWSLLSGLEYIDNEEYGQRAGTWRTRNLVEWRSSNLEPENQLIIQKEGIINGNIMLDYSTDSQITPGWKRHGPKKNSMSVEKVYYTHNRDKSTRFKSPFPVSDSTTGLNPIQNLLYLSCSTFTATFFPAAVLNPASMPERRGDIRPCSYQKISAFEHTMFQEVPDFENHCSVLALQQLDGTFAGLIRLMDDSEIPTGVTIDLCAISTGSASIEDMMKSFEWQVFEQRKSGYTDGVGEIFYIREDKSLNAKITLDFDIAMAFSSTVVADVKALEAGLSEKQLEAKGECDCEQRQARGVEGENQGSTKDCPFWDHSKWYSWDPKGRCPSCVQFSELCVRDPVMSRQISTEPRWRNHFFAPLQRCTTRSQSRLRDEKCSVCSPSGEYLHGHFRCSWLERLCERRYGPSGPPDIGVCEFYNVLWVEYKNKIAYRRACGWVPKHIWEANASGPKEITLG